MSPLARELGLGAVHRGVRGAASSLATIRVTGRHQVGVIYRRSTRIDAQRNGVSAAKIVVTLDAWEPPSHQAAARLHVVTGDAHPDNTVVIVVGSSSRASHRIVGLVAVGLGRRCAVPVVIAP